MKVVSRVDGITPVEKITLELTGPEYDTVLRSLRRMQVGAGLFTRARATQTYGHRRRAEHLHRELTRSTR